MAIYDMLMLIMMIGAILLGAWRGMAWQLAPIASLLIGGVAAYESADQLAPWFGDNRPTNYLFALLTVYVVVSLGIYLIARSVRNVIEKFKMEAYDRHLGAILGGVKGLLLCLVVTFFLVTMSPPAREHIRTSHSGYLAAIIMDQLHEVMPPAVHDAIGPYIHSLDDTVEESSDKHGYSLQAHRNESSQKKTDDHAHDHDHAHHQHDHKVNENTGKQQETFEKRFLDFAKDELQKALQR